MGCRPPYASDFDRVWSRVTPGGPSDCWDWQGAVGRRGYPVPINRGRRPDGSRIVETPPRLAWRTMIGPIAEGMTIDHLCRRPLCCNPHHLELVTLRENVRRRDDPTRYPAVNPPVPFPTVEDKGRARQGTKKRSTPVSRKRVPKPVPIRAAERTHCRRGHEHAVFGWYTNGVGKRTCAECSRARSRTGGTKHGTETHCPQGHPYSGENLRIARTPGGGTSRQCRECGRANSHRQYLKRKAAQV